MHLKKKRIAITVSTLTWALLVSNSKGSYLEVEHIERTLTGLLELNVQSNSAVISSD